AAVLVRHLDQAQLADVAGERGLGDLESSLGETFAQDFLRGDALDPDQVENGCVSLGLHGTRRAVMGWLPEARIPCRGEQVWLSFPLPLLPTLLGLFSSPHRRPRRNRRRSRRGSAARRSLQWL